MVDVTDSVVKVSWRDDSPLKARSKYFIPPSAEDFLRNFYNQLISEAILVGCIRYLFHSRLCCGL